MDMKKVRLVLFALLVLLVLVVIFRNLEETRLELIVTTVTLPLAALLLVTLAIGFAMGLFMPTIWKMRSWRRGKNKPAKADKPA